MPASGAKRYKYPSSCSPALTRSMFSEPADVLSDTPLKDLGGFDIDPDQTLYAVHGANGERLAVMIGNVEHNLLAA